MFRRNARLIVLMFRNFSMSHEMEYCASPIFAVDGLVHPTEINVPQRRLRFADYEILSIFHYT